MSAWMIVAWALVWVCTTAHSEDLRGVEILRMDCRSGVGQRDVTLFGNGMVRVRRGPEAREGMDLMQLDAAAFEAIKHQLAKEDLSESDAQRMEAGGMEVEHCTVHLSLEGRPEFSFTFQPLDSLSLAQSHIVGVVRELSRLARQNHEMHGLPLDYTPRPGDVLRRTNGALYEVTSMTSDGKGVELQGVDQPLVLFVALKDMRQEFIEVTHRAAP